MRAVHSPLSHSHVGNNILKHTPEKHKVIYEIRQTDTHSHSHTQSLITPHILRHNISQTSEERQLDSTHKSSLE